MKGKDPIRICLVEGDQFQGNQQRINFYYDSLFESFSLLSWLNESYEIQIIQEDHIKLDQQSIAKKYTFNAKNIKNNLVLVEFNKDYQKRTIDFELVNLEQLKQIENNKYSKLEPKIKVIFSQHTQNSRVDPKKSKKIIFIDIQDSKNYLGSITMEDCEITIINYRKNLKPHQIQYYYKEPTKKRHKEDNKCHFSLAFQGGGAKGISYVGVYKALKQLHKNVPINSIIGSSAGGILALAISTEMSSADLLNLCLNMDKIPEDRLFNKQTQITQEMQKKYDDLIQKIKCLLHNYGILESTIFDTLANNLFTIETGNKLLDVLEVINPSIAQILSLQLKRQYYSNKAQALYTHKFNYYGFLEAALMKGEEVQNIAAQCIINFIRKHFDPEFVNKNPKYKKRVPIVKDILKKWGIHSNDIWDELEEINYQTLKQKAKTLTFKQYYAINQLEFTCTSVDLDDRILRFFNHKTTPDLPVCKAVQMTGSFPIAFKAQIWKKQYGKYFIHYTHTRKEIDLTGHTFTDGGLLANFPIKYLDNEEMRPMYFSHKKMPQYTILYGFGLDPKEDKSEAEDKSKQQKLDKAILQLKKHIMSNISKLGILSNLIHSNSKTKLKKVGFEQIPILNYIIKLMNTLSQADYNLNIECFSKTIIQSVVEPKTMPKNREVKAEIIKINKCMKAIQKLEKTIQKCKEIKPQVLLRDTCEKIKDRLNEYENLNPYIIEDTRQEILTRLLNYQASRIKYQISQCDFTNITINKLQNIYPKIIMKLGSLAQIKHKLLIIVQTISNYFINLQGEEYNNMNSSYIRMIETQLLTINHLKAQFDFTKNELQKQTVKFMNNQQFSNITDMHHHIIDELINIEQNAFISNKFQVKEFMQELKQLQISHIIIDKQIKDRRLQICNRLNGMVKGLKSNKIHLVLEAKQNSHLYYCGLFTFLQQILNKPQNEEKKIEMITCASQHSVFAFLLAGGRKIGRIRAELWKVKDLICFEDNIEQQYDSFAWAKTTSESMKQLMQLSWKEQYKLFDELQKYLNTQKDQNLQQQIQHIKTQFLYSKDSITRSLETVLDHVLSSLKNVLPIKDEKEKKKKIAQLLSLSLQETKNYDKKNKAISKHTKNFIIIFMHHFSQLIIYTMFNSIYIKGIFQKLEEKDRQKVWKGFIIKKLLNAKKLQIYIKKALEDMKLKQSTTLSQYYEYSPRKITLNFVLINKNKERIEIANRFTKPNMPIWAAIMSSASMPYVLPEFNCTEDWNQNPLTDSKLRQLINYFFNNNQQKVHTAFIGGNYTSTLPLELLTNHKMAKENYTNSNVKNMQYFAASKGLSTAGFSTQNASIIEPIDNSFSCITFAFIKQAKQDNNNYQYREENKKFLNFSNLLNIVIDFMMGKLKNISIGFRDILSRSQLNKLMSTRIESHDNTILKLYYDQTIKLPIKLGTLDFYKLQNGRSLLFSSIYQAQFVVREIFDNLSVSEDGNSYSYLSKKQTYLQYFRKDDVIFLKFCSRSPWNRKLATMYNVYYKSQLKDTYLTYKDQYINFPVSQDIAYIKFVFPNMLTLLLQEREFQISFEKLKNVTKRTIFKFNFEEVSKKRVEGTIFDDSRLKTNAKLPESKPFISEHNFDQNSAHSLVKNNLSDMKKVPSIMKKESTQADKENQLILKSIVSLKNNGMCCKGCVRKLERTIINQKGTKNNKFQIGKCYKCLKNDTIIGYKCKNNDCKYQEQNQYCFHCLLVYLIKKQTGIYKCTQKSHQFILKKSKNGNSKQTDLCHFCSSATTTYYRDQECNINICQGCSLYLDTRKTHNF